MEKLYQQDPFLTRFTAEVVSCAADKGGWSVVLDRTAFYPEGGGQPWDTGTLNGIPVTQVQEQDGAVVHTCAARLEPGTQVEGAVDWARRFDLMQQHSGDCLLYTSGPGRALTEKERRRVPPPGEGRETGVGK